MSWKEFFKPTLWKVITTIILSFLIPGFLQMHVYYKMVNPEVVDMNVTPDELPTDLITPEQQARDPVYWFKMVGGLLLIQIERLIYAYILICAIFFGINKVKK